MGEAAPFRPDGRVTFLASPRKVTKRRRPRRGRSPAATTLRYSDGRAAAQLGPAIKLRGLRQCSPTAPDRPALLGGPNGGPKAKSKQSGCRATRKFPTTVENRCVLQLGSPLGPPRSAACLGEVREHCLRERSDRVAQRPRQASIAGQSRSDRPLRGRLLLVTFLGEARKVTRPSGRNNTGPTKAQFS